MAGGMVCGGSDLDREIERIQGKNDELYSPANVASSRAQYGSCLDAFIGEIVKPILNAIASIFLKVFCCRREVSEDTETVYGDVEIPNTGLASTSFYRED